jgi:hypothetical protein
LSVVRIELSGSARWDSLNFGKPEAAILAGAAARRSIANLKKWADEIIGDSREKARPRVAPNSVWSRLRTDD